jgi:hypothetical protein
MGQTINVENIENGRQVFSNESLVLVVGYSYKSDGYGQLSIIQAYDTTLNLKWTFTLNDNHTNTIDKIRIADRKIIFTGLVGERDRNNLKTNRYIKALDFNEKKILDENIGTSTYSCSNLSIDGNIVFFSYQKCETTLFSDMMYKSKNVLVEYDLTTKKLEFQEHFLIRSQPVYVTLINKKYFLFGEQYKNEKYNVTQTFIKSFPNENNEVFIPSDKMESVGKIVKNQNGFTVVSYSNPFVENQERYLKFDKVDFNSKLESTKYLLFSKLGWFHIYLEFTSVENELWFYAFKSDKEAAFIRLNEKGETIEEIKSNILDGSNDFYATRDFIYHLYKEDEKLKLTKIKR